MDGLIYYIWLSLRCGAGSEAPSFLISRFGSPKAVHEADEKTLAEALTGRKSLVEALCDKDLDVSARVLEYCHRTNVGIITPESDVYPERLRSIHAKPIVLYYKGSLPKIDERVVIACVGTRNCSDKGARNAYKLGEELARSGAIVVSGMAKGIDTMCARGALSAGGHTVAVLGCGIDRVYPRENEKLMADIIRNGTVITEYAPGMVPNGKHFPVRNRIISGLSLGTVVVEADMGSGALITAEHARKQGRDVFAFPGDIDNPYYRGTNELISSGAIMVRSAADILSEYGGVWYKRIFKSDTNKNIRTARAIKRVTLPEDDAACSEKTPLFELPKKGAKKKRAEEKTEAASAKEAVKEEACAEKEHESAESLGLVGLEKLVYENISGTCTADEITLAVSRKTGETADTGAVLGALTSLEIYGYCESMPGGLFRKI